MMNQTGIQSYCKNLTYHSLDHLHPLLPDSLDHSLYVHQILLLNLLQNTVNSNEGASTPNSSTTVSVC